MKAFIPTSSVLTILYKFESKNFTQIDTQMCRRYCHKYEAYEATRKHTQHIAYDGSSQHHEYTTFIQVSPGLSMISERSDTPSDTNDDPRFFIPVNVLFKIYV